jgi:hypothetical protein
MLVATLSAGWLIADPGGQALYFTFAFQPGHAENAVRRVMREDCQL